jgi:hypothetical protein
MGIEVVVEDERGTKLASLEDPTNILHRVLPSQEDSEFQCLNRVDWYGDTTFNRHQIPDVRRELNLLATTKKKVEEVEMVRKLEVMATKAEAEPHLFLKFYGD